MSCSPARLLDALPQTQCTRCGYPDCRGYAQALAAGEAGIDQCPPGGQDGVRRLAALTGRPEVPLNPAFGQEGPRQLALIDENWCIGCTLCLDACPTDAIIGIAKRMHTVMPAHCTGCELCIPVCPVDCIALEEATPGRSGWAAWSPAQAAAARQRYEVHAARLQTRAAKAPAPAAEAHPPATPADDAAARKRRVVEAALARARQAAATRAPAPAARSKPKG